MRKIALLTAVAALSAVIPVAAVHAQSDAASTATTTPCTPTTQTPCHTIAAVTDDDATFGGVLPAGPICDFQVDVSVVTNDEIKETWAFTDGSTVEHFSGPLVLRFTNHARPDKSVVRDVSGDFTTTLPPGGQLRFDSAVGNNWFVFGPNSQRNIFGVGAATHGLVFTRGFVTVQGVGQVSNSFVLGKGARQKNGCTVLKA